MTTIIIRESLTRLYAIIGILALCSCSPHKKEEHPVSTDSAVQVVVAMPSGTEINDLNLSGQVEASQSVNISTRIMGIITKLGVKVGDHVSKDELLVTISNQDILARRAQTDAQIATAQAALDNAQRDFDRITVLYNQQSATAKELDNVTLQFQSARSGLEAAKQMRNEVNANLGYTNLRSPFSGIVAQKMADAGSMAIPGMTVLTIEKTGSFQVTALIPESLISQVHTGEKAIINIQSVQRKILGIITQVSASSVYTGGQYQVKVSIPENDKKGLYAGMYADISIPVKNITPVASEENNILVPITCIIYKDQLTGLYTVGSDNTALLRWVRLGKTRGDQVEVLTGLSKNEQFIIHADGNLYNGIPVKIK